MLASEIEEGESSTAVEGKPSMVEAEALSMCWMTEPTTAETDGPLVVGAEEPLMVERTEC